MEPQHPERLRVLVADDHEPMLESLVRILARDYDVVATVTDGHAAVATAARLDPDVLVLDIAMPGLNGISAAAQLKEAGSKAKLVFVTMHCDKAFVQKALELGEVAFVAKDRLVMDLLPAMRAVNDGKSFVSQSIPR